MQKMKSLCNFSNFIVCILCLGVWCNGEDESISAPMKSTEQEALYSAIQGFVGKWWNGSDLYPDPCGWTPIQGVSCDLFDGFWYVTDLSIGSIHDNSLICEQNVLQFSPHLFALSHLKSLSFSGCFVSPGSGKFGIPARNWEAFAESLVSLEFRSNPGLTGKIPVAFTELRKLESLVLTENGLSGEIPAGIGNLVYLKRLNLAGNRFRGKIPDNFQGLNRLLILDFSRNSLNGPLPLTFGGLTSLLKLDLSNNQLGGEIPQEISNLKNLKLLDLSNNKLSGQLTKSLLELTSLEELVLSNNPIGGSLADLEWRNLVELGALDLSNMVLTGGIPESLVELKGLRFLGLNNNKLTGYISPKLANLPNVTSIFIQGNNLTGELRFSKWFYEKMGRRFGAWGNPNLCYPTGSVPPNYAPFGVKLCQQEVTKLEKQPMDNPSKIGDGIWNYESNPMISLGFRSRDVGGLLLAIEVLVVLIGYLAAAL
ncbi:piriformospora indica-insensitive protein 2-like [Dorcoceras hygrometricum]|uniref:Piriformospora indica-insensitive protein 2-like n=1 Tax=Dorcoceras hygrometricum TaxID=472368 RepID=A0A2Z7D1F9_9LAMI|nr:piriformospora indica-insensitive protein 2-like [Dorcoceras hygrometricum]